jgi:putative glycosyltransferase (TIGR04372 family)
MINKKNIIRVLKYETDLILTLPLLSPFLFFLIIIYPFIKIKIGFLRSDRIGHFSVNTELYLLEKKINKIKSIDLFYLGRKPVCNVTLERLWRKELIIFPRLFLRPLCILIRFFKFLKFLRCGNTLADDRDILNLLDQYPPTLKLSDHDLTAGENERLKIGLPKKAKFVCLIVRDSAYLEKLYIGEDMSMHDYRDADVNDFIDACEALTDLGYYVIRMGVAVKKPIRTDNKMIIDYAYNNLRTDFMDIYLASQCEFCITTGTGFDGTTIIFRKPNIYVNSAPLFLLRTECLNMLSIPCYYYSKKFSRNLTISEIVNKKSAVYLDANLFQRDGIELIKNSSEEIKQLVIEAAKRHKKEWQDDEGDKLQEKFMKIFPSTKIFDTTTYHGEIKGRIGSDFLKKNKWWLN